jgi:uncharacterized tellurite resistance protein B-like protein
MSIMDFLGLTKKTKEDALHPVSGETETVRKIVSALDQMEPERARFIAAFAFILCRVARADLNISPSEVRLMERIVMERSGLPEEQVILVVQMAKTQNTLFGGTENFLVTREFNEIATREQKLALLDCLFALASDELISEAEDNEISRICRELQLSREDFIAVRSAYRDYRAVLRKPPEPAR